MIALLTSTSDWHHHGWFWLWPLVPLLWLAALFLLARLVFWRGRRGPWAASDPVHGARAVLAERYARGEISYDEYRDRLGHLEER